MEISPEILINYIENPERLNQRSQETIDQLVDSFPFFQTARLLQIKNLQKTNKTVDKKTLNLTAAYVTDRKVLYYLLYKLNSGSVESSVGSLSQNKICSFEKEYKESLKENIAETLNKQLHYYEVETEHEIELIPGLAIDVRKEYGDGIVFDDHDISFSFRKQLPQVDIFELTEETETDFLTEKDSIMDRQVSDDSLEFSESFDEETEIQISGEETTDSDTEPKHVEDLTADKFGEDAKSFDEWLDLVEHKTTTPEETSDQPVGESLYVEPEEETDQETTAKMIQTVRLLALGTAGRKMIH